MAAASDQPPVRRSALRTALQAVVLLAAVGYIVWGLVGQWDSLRQREWTFRTVPLLASLPLAAGWYLGRGWLWQRLLASFGYPMAYRAAFRTWILSELGRYLPGKIWYLLGRSYLAREQGVPAPVALTAMAFELGLLALAAMALAPLRAGAHALPMPALWAGGAALLLLALAHPKIVLPLINAVLRRMGRPAMTARLGYPALLGMLGLCALLWLCLAAGFVLLVVGIAPLGMRDAVTVGASFPVAWLVGLAAVVAPGGLGVREGVLAVLLRGVLSGGLPVVAALASRLWLTVLELACAAAMWRSR